MTDGGPGDRRLRLTMPGREEPSLRALESLLLAAGALETSLGREGRRVVLAARLGPLEPAFLEDRVESWLHQLDPDRAGTLESATGAGPWEEGWRGVYRGALAHGFHVRPAWVEAAPGARSILVDPRGGFGSGLHPTTQLTLGLLARACEGRSGARLLDVGAGGGVLSIAAARLGLSPVAVDIEEAARLAARRAALENGVTVEVLDGGLESVRGRFAVIAANLNPDAALALAPQVRERLEPGGAVVASGFAPAGVDGVLRAYGLAEEARAVEGEWAALLLRG